MSAQEKASVVRGFEVSVLSWFTGKARENAQEALAVLATSEELGSWVPKASRTARAALGKANVAAKLGKLHEEGLKQIGDYKTPNECRGWEVSFLLRFGYSSRGVNFAAVREAAPTDALKEVIDTSARFAADLAPIKALMDKLDATRPVPTITYLGASPTVTTLLASLGLHVKTSTIRCCPIEWTEVATTDDKGKVTYRRVGRLVWPSGTVHGASRYDSTRANNQCQACGHAIKNPFNWVPLLVDNEEGVPHSLWVGRDCAHTLFGVKVMGEVELATKAEGSS